MILPDKRPEQSDFANLTDYSQKCPKGMRSFFGFATFEDGSYALFSNIFAVDRLQATKMFLNKFIDCFAYMTGYSLQEAL